MHVIKRGRTISEGGVDSFNALKVPELLVLNPLILLEMVDYQDSHRLSTTLRMTGESNDERRVRIGERGEGEESRERSRA